MLASVRFDAYGILKEYAKHPGDSCNLVALGMLNRRTRSACMVEAAVHSRSTESYGMLLDAMLGGGSAPHEKAESFEGKSSGELMDMYTEALKSSGIEYDPEALLEARRKAGLSTGGK